MEGCDSTLFPFDVLGDDGAGLIGFHAKTASPSPSVQRDVNQLILKHFKHHKVQK